MIRELFNHCDMMGGDPAYSHIQDRRVMEACRVRQFFERRGNLVRLFLTVPFVVHAPKPLECFASKEEVEATRNTSIPELHPIEPWAHFEQEQIYRDVENFPITNTKHSAPHVVLGKS